MIDLLVGDKVLLHPTKPREFRVVKEWDGVHFRVENDSIYYTVDVIAEILHVSELRG